MEKLNIPQNLYKQYLMGKYCDLQIQVENSYFRAHSCVVAASSWVLEAILQSSTAEDANLSKLSIQLHGVTAHAISSLLNFIYTGRFSPETYTDDEKRRDVLHAAKLYKMDQVPKEFEAKGNGQMTNLQMLESGSLDDSLLENLVPSESQDQSTDEDAGDIILVRAPDGENEESESAEPDAATEKLSEDVVEAHVLKNVSYAKEHGILYCLICCQIFPDESKLISHMNEHRAAYRKRPERAASSLISFDIEAEADYIEDYTDVDYNSKRKKRASKVAFTCQECSASYSGKLYLIKHYNSQHPGALYCKFCAERFTTEALLSSHLLTHAIEIDGNVGDKISGNKRSASRKGAMTRKRGHRCVICSTSFTKRKDLMQHRQNLHGITIPMHVCTTCGKEFKEKASLRAHTRVHTGEKPYMCSFCGNSFADAKTWKDHERRHRGEKPFLCTTCGKSFTYRQSFTRHMKFHEGKRPHQCSFCGKAFVLRQNLKEHERRHNK